MYKIYIPSYGRAGSVLTTQIFPEAIVVVPKSQEADYLKFHDNIKTVPDDMDGNIAKKRNAIISILSRTNCVMLDDDLEYMKCIKTGRKLFADDVRGLFCFGFEVLEHLGFGLFGFNWDNQPLHMDLFKPFSFNKCHYQVFGIRKRNVLSDVWFDDKFNRNEDIDYWMQQVQYYKATFRFNWVYFHFKCKDKKHAGGIPEKEESDNDNVRMLQKWGSALCSVNKQGNVFPVKSPYKGV